MKRECKSQLSALLTSYAEGFALQCFSFLNKEVISINNSSRRRGMRDHSMFYLGDGGWCWCWGRTMVTGCGFW